MELRASSTLASIFALRMLGLFLILPVFAVHARSLPGGTDTTLIGLALGIYGLTQGLLQIPVGMASDRLGRKPVIVAGLLVFAAGSFMAAAATDVWGAVIGRAIQGAGAISAAVTAFIADATRDSQRTKAMAMVGASIGLTFALSLIGAPLLYASVGMAGIFTLTGLLALGAIAVVIWMVPAADQTIAAVRAAEHAEAAALQPRAASDERADATAFAAATAAGEGAPAEQISIDPPRARDVLLDGDLLRLNLGIFVLHAIQMAMFVVLPGWLEQIGALPLEAHWKVYLPVVLLSFALMMPPLNAAERRGRLRALFVAAVAGLAAVQALLALRPQGLLMLAALLLGFFVVFNILEATLPSLVSRLAPPASKGLALGVYNTTQALGLFVGGAAGGWIAQRFGGQAVFVVTASLCMVWALVAPGLRRWPGRRAARR